MHITFDRSSQAAWGTKLSSSSRLSSRRFETSRYFNQYSPSRTLTVRSLMCQVILRTDLWRRLVEKNPNYKAYQVLYTFIATIMNKLYVSDTLEPLSALRTCFYLKNFSVTFKWFKFCTAKHFMFAVIFLYSSGFQTLI